MKNISRIARVTTAAFLVIWAATLKPAFAAGAVEMQVEHMLLQAIEEYNTAMESGDTSAWVKYFTDNVQRRSPVNEQTGKKDVGEYFAWEFKNFQAKMTPKKILVSGRAAAVVFMWEGIQKSSNAAIKLEMVGIFEMASSGRFDHVSYYYDTAKAGKILAEASASAK